MYQQWQGNEVSTLQSLELLELASIGIRCHLNHNRVPALRLW